jgi:hypothetical protein
MRRPQPLLFMLLAALAACDAPTLDQVRVAFKQAHPGYEVLSVEHPSGKDAPVNAYRVKYRRPGHATIQVVTWTYDPPRKASPASPQQDSTSKLPRDSAKLPEPPRAAI